MTRAEILAHALFDTGGEIDGLKFGPLSVQARVNLTRRKSTYFVDSPREQSQAEAVAEVLFVLTRTNEERVALARDSQAEWDTKVEQFLYALEENTLSKFFSEYFEPAMVALALSAIESERPGKSQQSRPTSPSTSKGQNGLDSTSTPAQLADKIHSGISPSRQSFNSSTPKQFATAQASAGSTGPKQTRKGSPSSTGSRRKK